MPFIKRSQLLKYDTVSFSESAKRTIKTASMPGTKTVFLSHSHKDKELAIAFKNLLGSLGIDLYIDWQDSEMPEVTNYETAKKIKEKIRTSRVFLLLATDFAVQSRWVPWEIGIADGVKPYESIILIPIADDTGKFQGNEYLQLYNHLEYDYSESPIIMSPSSTNKGGLRAFISNI